MKKEIKRAVFVISLIIFAAASFKAQDNNNPLPTSRGNQAIEKLKQNGQYDSLMEAVKSARQQGGRTESPAAANAVAQTAKLTASDGDNGDDFGFSVSIDGNTAVAGAWRNDVGANPSQGAAYIFVRNGTTWTQQQKLTASDGAPDDFFGISVAIDGDTLIVGAFKANIGINAFQGAAYVFVRSGTTWTERQKLIASDGADRDSFGFSVALSGNKIFIGAYAANIGMQNDQGVAYIFISKFFVGGRILTADGSSGVPNAIVQMTLANGETRTTRSSGFGYYRFDEVEADQTVTISVSSKRFQFTPQTVQVNGNLTGVDFPAQP